MAMKGVKAPLGVGSDPLGSRCGPAFVGFPNGFLTVPAAILGVS
jgi:hypothetical protein